MHVVKRQVEPVDPVVSQSRNLTHWVLALPDPTPPAVSFEEYLRVAFMCFCSHKFSKMFMVIQELQHQNSHTVSGP